MQDYIKRVSSFLHSHENGRLLEFIPDRLCPFLYYNLLPYIVCIAGDGYFGWIRYTTDNRYRKKICKPDFAKKSVNRLYPNEVLVKCPNNKTCLVCGIGPYGPDEIKIRILGMTHSCPNSHMIQDEFLIKKQDASCKAKDFNRIFPSILFKTFGHMRFAESLNNGNCRIEVDEIISPCRYSQNRQRYIRPFLPQDFCIHLFQLIYPDILALMYDADVPKACEIKCHCQEEPLKIEIKKEKINRAFFFGKVTNLAEKIFEIIFYPYDRLDYRIKILVTGKISNNCSLKNNYVYEMNIKGKDFICPASFHVIYPYLMLATRDIYINWDSSPSSCIPCPDCKGTIYRIDKELDDARTKEVLI